MTASLAALADQAVHQLVRAGFAADEGRVDVGVLARHVLHWDTATWIERLEEPAPAGFSSRLDVLVARRARREPVAYLTGVREFYGRSFEVTPDVLIPRPETETLVDCALAGLRKWRAPGADARRRAPWVIDVGTGSGCIAVTLASELPTLRPVATDTSPEALAIARKNAERLGVAERVTFRLGPLLASDAGPWDLIVSNPPYISRTAWAALPPDVQDFEPRLALDGGNDGLDVIRALIAAGSEALAAAGTLIVEIGAGQDRPVRTLFGRYPMFEPLEIQPDLAGVPRVVIARRSA